MALRIGIMSAAHVHADGYALLLRAMPGVEFLGFSDEDEERGRAFAANTGARWFARHEDLLAEKPDGVIICSENRGHLELVQLAAAAGAHVLCEKPIEVTRERAQAMRDACQAHGVRFMTAFPMRFDPSVREVYRRLRNGDLGQVLAVNGINHSENPSRHRAWFADPERAGGGAVMDHTVHLADLYRWLFDAEVASVFAEVDNLFARGTLAVDTAGLIQVTLANGIFASIDCSWSRPAGYPRWGHLQMEIIGERGTLVLDAFAQALTVYAQGGTRWPEWVQWGSDPNRAMIEHFLHCVRTGQEPEVGWRDGYAALEVALAAYESAAAGTVVTLAAGA
ncbi:MAG: Gfo/Idh/MocA family oxidoreductase [Limnochordales bacterium]